MFTYLHPDYAIRICPWYSELMPIMSHSAAAMVGPGRSTLDEGEDKDRERLRKRIRHAKEEEREDDDNGQCDTGLEQFGLDESESVSNLFLRFVCTTDLLFSRRYRRCNALTPFFIGMHPGPCPYPIFHSSRSL